MSEWISVEDRLPERSRMNRSKCVLVYCPVINCQFTALYDYGNEVFEHFGGTMEIVHNAITHWMPLPDPPEE